MTTETTAATTRGPITVEQIIDDMPRPGLTKSASVALNIGFFLALWEAAALAPALPTLERGLGVDTAALAIPIAIMFLGFAIGAYVVGVLSDRYGRQLGLRVTFSTITIGALLSAVAWNVPSLAAGRFIVGCGMGAVMFLVTMYIGEVSPKNRRGRTVALYQLTATVLIVVCSLASLPLIGALPNDAWRPMFGLPVIAIVVVFLVGKTHLVESPRWLVEHGRFDQAVAVARRLDQRARRGASTLADAVIVPSAPKPADELAHPVRTLFRHPKLAGRVVLLAVVMILFFTGLFGYSTYQISYIMSTGISEVQAEVITSVSRVSAIAAGILIFLLIEKIERRILVLICLGLFVVGMAITMAGPIVAAQLVGCLVLGVGAGMFAPSIYTYTAEIFPTEVRGTAAAFGDGVGRLGGVVAPFTFVPLLAAGGVVLAGGFTVALMVVAALLVAFGLRVKTKGRSLEEITD